MIKRSFITHVLIITDSVLLWKIQKFDWLIPETKWHSCLHNRTLFMHNRTLCSETRIHSNRVEPEKTIDSKSIKTFHCLTERWYVAIIARCDASLRAFMYRDASHLWHSFSHNRTKINIQFLSKRMYLRKLLNIRYTLSYVKHALLNLYVYFAFNVR